MSVLPPSDSRPIRLPALAGVAAIVGLLALAAPARAQTSSSASVTADVQQPITVTKTSDLAFGTIFPGLAKTVAVTDGGAAAFAIQGQAGGNVNLTFSLPTNITSGGGASLPITAWAARRATTSAPAAGTDFVPGASAASAVLGGSGYLYVFLGATAQPSASQPAGSYNGSATMTVVYF